MTGQELISNKHFDKPISRIHTIDFTKGILVFLMVVYHVLNYLQYDSLPHEYMAFLPPSFIMITGFLVTQTYLKRLESSFLRTSTRLGARALKLLFLFTFLNVTASIIWSKNRYDMDLNTFAFFHKWFNVYMVGDAMGVAFEVLIPISYTLLLSIILLKIQLFKPYFLTVFAITMFTFCAIMDTYGRSIPNLNLISVGIIGMGLGMFRFSLIERLVRYRKVTLTLAMIYSIVLILDVDNYIHQVIITIICLALIYSIGVILQTEQWWYKQFCLLGRYSLISYIAQILYLQLTKNVERTWLELPFNQTFLLMLVIAFMTWGTVVFVDYGRIKNGAFGRIYNAIFA